MRWGRLFWLSGTLHAQQPKVEARIAGLEGNAEYMSLLKEDARLQIREDSIVNAVERMRRRLREDPRGVRSFRRRYCSWRAGFSRSAMPRGV